MKLRKKIIMLSLSLGLMLTSELLPINSAKAEGFGDNDIVKETVTLKLPNANIVYKLNKEDHSLVFDGKNMKVDWKQNDKLNSSRGIVVLYVLQPTNESNSGNKIEFAEVNMPVMLLRNTDHDNYIDGSGELYCTKGAEEYLDKIMNSNDYEKYKDKYDVDDDNDGIANEFDVNPKDIDKLTMESISSSGEYLTNAESDTIIATSSIKSKNSETDGSTGPVIYKLEKVNAYFSESKIYTVNNGDVSEVHLKGRIKSNILGENEAEKTISLGKLLGKTVSAANGDSQGAGEVQNAETKSDIKIKVSKTEATRGNPLSPKVDVNDKNHLTKDEKKKVEDGVKKANQGSKDITVNDDGTVNYKDEKGKKKYLKQEDTVKEKEKTGSNGGNKNKPSVAPHEERREGTKYKSTHRVSGSTRYATAAEVSKGAYPNGAEEVILSNSEKFSDVLTAVPYGKVLKAPILYVDYNRLPKETLNEMKRLGAKKVVLVGGNQTVSPEIANKIKNMGLNVSRIGGKDRYETSKMIGERVRNLSTTDKKDVIVASGEVFPDALSISPLALRDEAPILLAQKNNISKYTVEALKELSKGKIYISGGKSTISDKVADNLKSYTNYNVTRFAGHNRYDTSVAIARAIRPEAKISVFTSGEIFQDALVAGEMVNKYEAPLMLVKKNEVPKSVAEYVKKSYITRNVVVGGRNTVSDKVIIALEKIEER